MNPLERLRDAAALVGVLALAYLIYLSVWPHPEWPPVPSAVFPPTTYHYLRRNGPIQHEDFEQLAVEVEAIESKLADMGCATTAPGCAR